MFFVAERRARELAQRPVVLERVLRAESTTATLSFGDPVEQLPRCLERAAALPATRPPSLASKSLARRARACSVSIPSSHIQYLFTGLVVARPVPVGLVVARVVVEVRVAARRAPLADALGGAEEPDARLEAEVLRRERAHGADVLGHERVVPLELPARGDEDLVQVAALAHVEHGVLRDLLHEADAARAHDAALAVVDDRGAEDLGLRLVDRLVAACASASSGSRASSPAACTRRPGRRWGSRPGGSGGATPGRPCRACCDVRARVGLDLHGRRPPASGTRAGASASSRGGSRRARRPTRGCRASSPAGWPRGGSRPGTCGSWPARESPGCQQ